MADKDMVASEVARLHSIIDEAITASEDGSASDAIQDMLLILAKSDTFASTGQDRSDQTRSQERPLSSAGDAPTGPGWWWVLSADDRANERSFLPVWVSSKDGALGFEQDCRGGWVSVRQYKWGGRCLMREE